MAIYVRVPKATASPLSAADRQTIIDAVAAAPAPLELEQLRALLPASRRSKLTHAVLYRLAVENGWEVSPGD